MPNPPLKYIPLTLQSHQFLIRFHIQWKVSPQLDVNVKFISCCFSLWDAAREEEVGKRVSGVVKQDSSQLTPTPVGTRDVTSSQEESQSVPQSGLSPVLAQYKSYLQSCYKARALAPADKYLPTLQAPYINLAMIKSGYQGSDARDEFTRRTLHGGVDQILASKTPIDIEDLLVPEEGSSDPVRFILVEGPPGVGKSTISWEIGRRWDEIESLRDYHTVVLLRLREKWVLNAASLSDLFRYPGQPELSKSIADEMQKSNGQKALLILDGFDEVSHSFHQDSVIKSILCRELLPECTIILTTRPSAKHTLESVCQPRVDKNIEILGFTEEERVRYITEVFSKEPELQVNFLKHMFLVSHVKSMMYIPLNCAIIAQVYYESQQSSHHLAIPRTRTQLYKALTHSLLVRHMKMLKGDHKYACMLPEGLEEEHMENFKALAKFAFDSYHSGTRRRQSLGFRRFSKKTLSKFRFPSRKVTFFKEDIPEELVHFGFMNESTEMYAGKGVEQTFSFLHLSLQEYLAAWHLAHSYSIEFQVAYHKLAVEACQPQLRRRSSLPKVKPRARYKGSDLDEEALISSLAQHGESLVEPALFLSGITGLRSQSEDGSNHWEMYLSRDTSDCEDFSLLLRSLYEAQNANIITSHYFTAKRRRILIGSAYRNSLYTPYDCYALSYCLAHTSEEAILTIGISSEDDSFLVETLVKGLDDHCISSTPVVKFLEVELEVESVKISNKFMFWLAKARFLSKLEAVDFRSTYVNSFLMHTFLESLVKLQSLVVEVRCSSSLEWLAALKSLSELRIMHITCRAGLSRVPLTNLECGPVSSQLTEVVISNLPLHTTHDLHISTLVGSLLKSVLRSNEITKLCLPNISRETMADVHSILLHCPSLVSLELKKTRLGYDGMLYICSALRNNISLTHLLIHDDPRVPAQTIHEHKYSCTSFSSMERIPLPNKATCTNLLLELNNILKYNTTLEEIDIRCGLFLPVSPEGHSEYRQWTGLGPLLQFNIGAVGSGRSPNLRRSFSSSDLTQPQTLLFWDHQIFYFYSQDEVDFNKLFLQKKREGKKLFSLPSFTAPDTEVLQSFSGLDPRLKQCLGISEINHQYMETLLTTYRGIFDAISQYMKDHSSLLQ